MNMLSVSDTTPQNRPNYISKYSARDSRWNRKWRSASLCVLGAVSVMTLLKSNNQDYKLAAVQGLAYACFGVFYDECVAKTRIKKEYDFKYKLSAALILVLVTKIYCGRVLKLTKVFTEEILSELANRFFIATSVSYLVTSTDESDLKELSSAINQEIKTVENDRRKHKDHAATIVLSSKVKDPLRHCRELYIDLEPVLNENNAVAKLKKDIQGQVLTLMSLKCLKNGWADQTTFIKRGEEPS